MKILRWMSAACAVLTIAAMPGLVRAQDYPTRAIRLVVAFPPGGGADFTARTLGQKLSEDLGQPVVVDNKPGANGVLGSDIVSKAPPDGYTILLIDRGAMGINPFLYRNLSFDTLKDFAHITIATEAAYVLVVNPKVPATTFKEFVALAKKEPGKLNYASIGIGSMFQLNFERMKAREGINITHIPYKGAGPAITAVIQGEAETTVSSSAGVLAFIRDGKLRALAVGADKRLDVLPDVPTLAEAGGGADTLVSTYFGFVAPAGTPKPIVDKLNQEFRKIVHMPDVAQRLENVGLEPTGSTPEEFTAEIKRDRERFGKLVKELGIEPE